MEKEITDLEYMVANNIKELNIFQDVTLGDYSETSESTLLVKLSIMKIKKVGGFERFMLGAFAGKASMTTDVVFVDAASGKELGSYSVTGQSGGTGVSGGTSDAVREAAEGVAKVISENFTGK